MYKIKTLFIIAFTLIEGVFLVRDHGTDVVHHQERRALGDCGGNFYTDTGQLASPGYPSDYSDDQNCYYYIYTTSNLRIRLAFSLFITESTHDYVEVYDGSTTYVSSFGKYSGSTIPSIIHSTGSSLLLHFHSDYAVSYQGFLATYTSVSEVAADTYNFGDCGGTLTSETGAIVSPNYPYYYTENADCFFYISISSGQTVELEFDTFSLETCCDYVEIFDGSSRSSPSIGKYYTFPGSVITSSGSNLLLYFHSDDSISSQGFSASYGPGTGSKAYICSDTSSSVDIFGGTIQSHDPDTNPSYTTCTRTIVADDSFNQIYLKFTKINLAEDTGGCDNDYVTITDAYSNQLGSICDSDGNTEFTTNSGSLTLSFTVGYHDTPYDGFEAVFTLYYSSYGVCFSDHFLCANDKCIYSTLRCDGNDHCGDDSDEKDCSKVPVGEIVGGVIGGLILLVIIIVIIYCCCKKSSSSAPSTSTATSTTRTGSRPRPVTTTVRPVEPKPKVTVTYNIRITAAPGYTGGQSNPGYDQGQSYPPPSSSPMYPPPMQGQGPSTNTTDDPAYPPSYPPSTGYDMAYAPPPSDINAPGPAKYDDPAYPPPSMPPPSS